MAQLAERLLPSMLVEESRARVRCDVSVPRGLLVGLDLANLEAEDSGTHPWELDWEARLALPCTGAGDSIRGEEGSVR
jgi:hypothetical protein